MLDVRIGGFEPFSLSDFPGTVAAAIFTQGCNFRCSYCHNSQLLPVNGGTAPGPVLNRLRQRAGVVQGVVLTGGEPTLHPGLLFLAALLRWDGFRVKLDTNGSNPDVLQELLDAGVLDFVAMDVKAPPGRYHRVAGPGVREGAVWRSVEIVASSGVPHLFRTTWDQDLLSEADIRAIREALPSGSEYVVQRCRKRGGG